jgi:hypothetical protein
MKKKYAFDCLVLALVVMLGATAQADLLAISSSNGHLWTRDHSNLGPDVSEANFGGGIAIRAALNSLGELAVGRSDFANADVRPITSVSSDCCGATFGGPANSMTAVGVAENEHFALGMNDGSIFVRDRTNLGATAPGVSGDGTIFNTQINAIARLSNGHLVIANNNGEVFVRDKNDITQVAPGASADGINFGVPITSLAVTANDDVVIALSGGVIDTRPWFNIAASHGDINFAISGSAYAAVRSDGNVLLGFGNGQVFVRNPLNLGPDVDDASFGFAITALAVDKNDNSIIGDTLGQVFVRDANNLGQTPAGFSGDGINFGESILSLNVVPEPSTALLLAFGVSLIGFLRRIR